jgi:hypothetical protein
VSRRSKELRSEIDDDDLPMVCPKIIAYVGAWDSFGSSLMPLLLTERP